MTMMMMMKMMKSRLNGSSYSSCLVTVGVTAWIECSRLDHLFKQLASDPLTSGSVPDPVRDITGKKKKMKMMMMMIRDDDDD